MIFLFDKFKKLKGTVRNRHTISLLYERERNGLYTVSAEIPLKITDKKTVYNYHKKVKDSEFLGHYDREGRFQLHKIASVDIEDSSIYIKGVHLFFDEAKAGAIIQERRFRQSELIHGARVAFESIGWSVVDFDVSDEKDYIFYNVSPLEARAILVETFGFEFDYWLDFDGKNIRNKQISAKREMGKDSNKRYNYGHNVLNIKVEQDYSEIYTAVIGRGKGEDLGDDAYGRRIEYTDVEWKTPTNPMNKPKGSRVLHDENATQLFGYHEDGKVSPRTKVEIFEDIEDPAELLQETYNWLRENSVPKAVFSLEVPDGDGLDLGDRVHVIYRDIDLVKHTRVTRVVDDLVGGNRDVEFGDSSYFKTDRRLSGVKSEIKRVSGSMSSRISRLKDEFDHRFEDEIQQLNEDFEQALIDAGASSDALRAEITDEFEAAQREFEEEFNQSVADAKQYAEDTADAKAAQVQGNLDSFSDEHSRLLSEVQSDVIGVSDSLTGISSSLSDIEGTLTNTRTALENRIDATENALNQVGEDLGNAKTDLQKQLDDARAELDGLEVGGRNLLIMKDLNLGRHSNTSVDVDTGVISGFGSYYFIFENVNMKADTFYTFSYESSISNRLSFLIRNKETGDLQYIWNAGILPPNEKVTFKVPENVLSETENYHMWVYISNSENIEWQVEKIQLEKGTVATDWTPAPEDTDNKITNINQTITNIEGELSSKVEQTEVDTLTGRVANTESSVTQNAEEIAKKLTKSVYDEDKKDTDAKITQWSNTATETAEGLTRVIGRVSETEKGVDTAQTRIEAEAGRIDGLLSRTSNVEGKVSDAELAIKANADGLALRATKTEVENAIDGIEVGGRNLVLRSSNFTTTENFNQYTGVRNIHVSDGKVVGEAYAANSRLRAGLVTSTTNVTGLEYVDNQEYTYSITYKMDKENPEDIEFGGKFFFANGSGGETGTLTNFPAKVKKLSDDIYRAYGTFKVEGREDRVGEVLHLYVFPNREGYDSVIIEVHNVQIEYGNVLTPYSPAPEDAEAKITKAQADITANAKEIALRATQSELNSVTGRVSSAESQLSVQAGQIALRATKTDVEQAIDGIEVGGRNILLNSESKVRNTADSRYSATTISNLTPNTDYVYSAYVDVLNELGTNTVGFRLGPTNYKFLGTREIVDGRVHIKFRTGDSHTTLHTYPNADGQSTGHVVDFYKRQLEHGTLLTDWTPAPEDIDASISGVSDRVTTAEAEIEIHAGEISQKASQSELDRVSGRVSTAETSIKQNSDSLKLTATKAEVGNAIDGLDVGVRNLVIGSGEPVSSNAYLVGVYTMSEPWEVDQEYTVVIKGEVNEGQVFGIWAAGTGTQATTLKYDSEKDVHVSTFTLRSIRVQRETEFRIYSVSSEGAKSANVEWVMMVKGNKAPTSHVPAPEDTDAKINDISKDYVKQSSVKVTPDRVTIGSTIVNGSTIGSVLSVSPTGIDAVADAMRLSGDLLVAGDVTALAVNAVEGNFSRLFSKSLTTNVIKSNHIQTDTALAKKLFATNANIDELVTRTHFSNSIKTMSIEAAKANFASATASWFGANVIESSWLKVDTALFNRFTSSTAFINSLTAKNAFISDIKAIDIDLNRATITGGDGTNYIRMNNQNVMSYGTFTRSWGGETDTAKLELGLFDGQIRARNLDTGYRLYLTERGLSTSMAGAIDEFTSGTLEFHSQRFNANSRGVTMHSSYGAVAMISDYSTAFIRSNLTANIESNEYSVYIRPYRLSRPGTNDFRFWVKANSSSYQTDGVLSYGNLDSDTFGSGLRFSKSSNENTVYVTNSNGDIGTGHISVQDAEIRGHIRTAGRIDFQQWSDRSAYNQIGVGAVNTYNSLILASHTNGNAYLGVGYNELRVTNNAGYNGGNTGYRPIRVHALHTTGSYAFENHSGSDVYFGVGGNRLRVTNNNHYNGGNIAWRDIEFRNWKANSHEKYKKDIKEWNTNVLDIFRDELQLYQYKYRDNLENNMIHRGVVLREDSTDDKFPAEWRQDDGYNGNEVMWWNTKAIQELALENDSLKSEVAELRTQLNKIMEMIK